jgi:arginine N-succinyltransferase
MLKKIGFKYLNQVDPFDGGPHLWANVDELLPVKKLENLILDANPELESSLNRESGLLCQVNQKPGQFRAMAVQAVIKNGRVHITGPSVDTVRAVLQVGINEPVAFMPYY